MPDTSILSLCQVLLSQWEIPCQTDSNSVLNTSMLQRPSCITCLNSLIMGLLQTYSYQILAALFFGFILSLRQLKKSRGGNPKGLPLPPGPKGYLLIGSVFDMPIDKPWLVYDEWSNTYGKSNSLLFDSVSKISLFYRWYDIFQSPWPTFFDFELFGMDHWPVGEKFFKLLRQTATTYAAWGVCIIFLASQSSWKECLF